MFGGSGSLTTVTSSSTTRSKPQMPFRLQLTAPEVSFEHAISSVTPSSRNTPLHGFNMNTCRRTSVALFGLNASKSSTLYLIVNGRATTVSVFTRPFPSLRTDVVRFPSSLSQAKTPGSTYTSNCSTYVLMMRIVSNSPSALVCSTLPSSEV